MEKAGITPKILKKDVRNLIACSGRRKNGE